MHRFVTKIFFLTSMRREKMRREQKFIALVSKVAVGDQLAPTTLTCSPSDVLVNENLRINV